VELKAATNLPCTDFFTESDPYCKLCIVDEDFKPVTGEGLHNAPTKLGN
jgi:hypothetical protein